MDQSLFYETGNATTVLREEFSMLFELTNFDIEEAYFAVENTGNVRRKISFTNQTSSSKTIGQSINFPSSWCVTVQCKDNHARVALKFQKNMKDSVMIGSNGLHYAVVKFRINFVDKDGDMVYKKKWDSWQNPKKVYLTNDHGMADFIPLEELFDNQNIFLPDKTLRLLCEGVLYSNFMQSAISIEKFPLRKTLGLYYLDESDWYDVQLVSEGGVGQKAHKVVLGNASPILKSLLATLSNPEDGELPSLQLDDLTVPQISLMIEYIYTEKIEQYDWSNYQAVESLITLAKNYELRGLKFLCLKNLLTTISLSNFPKIVKLFQQNLADRNLCAMLYKFYIENYYKLIQTDSFKEFAREDKDAFLYIVLFNVNRH